jgi:DNA-binding transcriptional LysR family regulator
MQLTSRATELIGPLEEVCANIDHFFQRSAFDPMNSKRKFVIATSDALAYTFAPEILRVVRRHAPGIKFHFVDVGRDLTSRLAERQIDFAFLPEFALDDLAPAPLRFRKMDQRARAVLMCLTHPLAKQDNVSRADVLGYQHISFSPDAVMVGAHSTPKLSKDEPLDVAVRVPFVTVMPRMLVGTNLLAIVGRAFGVESCF